MRKRRLGAGAAILFALVGALLGSIVGHLLSGVAPWLLRSVGFGMGSPVSFNLLDILDLTVGIKMEINLAGAIGALLALVLFWK